MTEGYKTDKEAIASNASEKTGSSITHINLVSPVALVRPPNIYHCLGQASVPLFAAIQTRQPTQPLSFLSSWVVLMLPLLLSMTLFANHSIILLALRSVPTRLLLYSPMPKSGTPLPLRQPQVSSTSTVINQVRIPPLPALTTYRAHMMLMTILSILAVDFPLFPRNLVKYETLGVSLV